jgi:hypothetical protein
MIDLIFPSEELVEADVELIREVFSNPVIRRYLRILSAESVKDLMALQALAETPESLSNKHLVTVGKLEVLGTLLSLKGHKK